MFSPPVSDSLSFSLKTKADNTIKQIDKFLQFRLGSDRGGLTIDNTGDIALLKAELVVEVINVLADDILPVPHMFYCILGTYSWRSEMLWIVDLENLLGYPPPLSKNNNELELLVMVVEYNGQSIGFVVSKIDNLVEYDSQQFKSPSSELFLKDVIPFLQGYSTNSNNQIIMSIDVNKIFEFFSIKTEFNYSAHS